MGYLVNVLAGPVALFVVFYLTRLILISRRRPSGRWTFPEKTFVDPRSGSEIRFESIFDQPTPSKYISLIVPAYKEEKRLIPMMEETLPYLKSRAAADPNFTWEIIIVDDGSPDNTAAVANSYVEKEGHDNVRLLKLRKNVGKGGGVRRGMIYGRGRFLLMVDADGATKISDMKALEDRLMAIERDGLGVAIGSRAHLEETEVVVKRHWLRNFLMWGFHHLVAFLCVRGIRDTQCGFKMFTRQAAAFLFANQHIDRWAFDVELLFLAQWQGIPIAEVPVNWQEIEGSKLSPIAASIQIGRDMLRIRGNYLIGWWRIEYPLAKKV